MELPVEMDGCVRGLLGRHLLSELGMVAVMIRVKKEMGFKPCPFCGEDGHLQITSEEYYNRMREADPWGCAPIHIDCKLCDLELWRMNWTSAEEFRGYDDQVEMLREKWNERAK